MYRPPADYDSIKKVIIQIYLDYDISGFPLDEKAVCKTLGVSLIPYSEYFPEDALLFKKKSKYGFYVKGTRENPPTIYYNDKFDSEGAKRLTIFHELKHYIFNEDSEDEEKDDYADFFGRYFLCPIPYLIVKNIDTVNDVISNFGLSQTAAKNAVSNVTNRKIRYGKRIFDYEVPLLEHLDKDAFEIFLRNYFQKHEDAIIENSSK